MKYFKATRPDGTDFRTGSIDYAAAHVSGDTITHPSMKQDPNNAGTYLSISVTPTDCTGMRWPCRLFEVQPVGRALKAGRDQPSKRRVSRLRVNTELPAHMVFGPQGEAVAALIARVRLLTMGQINDLDAARSAARGAAWDAAWDAAWSGSAWYATRYARYVWYARYAWDATRSAEYAARSAAYATKSAEYAARSAARGAARSAARGAAWDAAGSAGSARYAVMEAAIALVVRDLITPTQFSILHGPWASVMGAATNET